MRQYVAFPANKIADEYSDPPFYPEASNPWAGLWTCPTGYTCRMADLAAYELDDTSNAVVGTLYRTVGPPTQFTANSTTIDGTTPTFTLSTDTVCVFTCWEDEAITLVTGDTAHTIGSTSGWRKGPVTSTCIDTGMLDGGVPLNKLLFCQTNFAARSAGGDSGSPIFAFKNGKAHAVGILWGGSGSGTDQIATYSPYGGFLDILEIGIVHFVP